MPRVQTLVSSLAIAAIAACASLAPAFAAPAGFHFPPPGQSLAQQNVRAPSAVGLAPDIVDSLEDIGQRWALWRHGYLVAWQGDLNRNEEVKSLVKVGFALTVGAALQQGRIPSYHQRLSVWRDQLTGNDALATWQNALTQSTGFDYPGCDDENDYLPGQMWTYSDLNMHELNQALARAYGRQSFTDNYALVWRQAFFDSIGMQGWSNENATDHARLVLDLEDMGRIGLLILARGAWGDRTLIPMWFIEQLETQQTAGMMANYSGCNDGIINLDDAEFPEPPYGFLCWSNSGGGYYPDADPAWSFASGAGGFYLLWNRNHGIVFAGVGMDTNPDDSGVPHIIEEHLLGDNPLVATVGVAGGGGLRGVAFAPPGPNPARETTTFRFTLAGPAAVRLAVFDLAGRRVAVLADGALSAGAHTRAFDLRDGNGRRLASGYYRARLEVDGAALTRGFLALP